MIALYGFAPALGLPSSSPFALKTEVQLKMMGLPFVKRCGTIDEAPKGKLPYITDGDEVVADSTFIRAYLEQRYERDLDGAFDAGQRALAWSVEKFVEDHLYWAMVYMRWGIDENFEKGPARFFDTLPEATRDAARRKQRQAVLSNLRGQGFGRHTPDEIADLVRRGYASLATLLGDKPYLLGDRACGADASVFGQVASLLTPWFDGPIRDAAAVHPNLAAYTDRIMRAYFPESGSV